MSKQIKRFYEFGAFRIDTVNRRLLCNGQTVPLKAKAVETLLLLVQHNGEVVEKDQLMQQLWPDSFVEEANLTQNIYMLRKALGEGRYIETIPRRGYRFAADVKEWEDTSADLLVIREKTKTSLTYEDESDESIEAQPVELNEQKSSTDASIQLATGANRAKAEALASGGRRLRRWLVVGLVASLLTVGAFLLWPRKSRPPFENVKLTRFTTTGTVTKAAISPDGKYIGFVVSEAGQQSLELRQVATGKQLQIIPPAHIEFYGLTFSHDGNYIYYVNQEMNHLGMLYQVPTLGGTPTKLTEDVDSPVTLSPDDKQLAFIRFSREDQAIVIANVDGTGERKLSSTRRGDSFRIGPNGVLPPTWSPDGNVVACPVGVSTGKGEYQTIMGFQTKDGASQPVTSEHWLAVGRIEWLPDGRGLLATVIEQQTSPDQQIWYVPYPKGAARKITNDLNDYRDLSLTTDAKALITILSEKRANIWFAPAADTNHASQLTFTNYDGLNGLAWTMDEKLVYTSQASGEQNLWIKDLNGGTPRQLTAHAGFNEQPAVSPDGRYIVFASTRGGYQHLWRIDIDGKHPVELTHGTADSDPSFTPDGRWIVFRSATQGDANIFRISIDGGEPVRLTNRLAGDPNVSPDGKLIALYYRTAPAAINQIATMPIDGGEPKLIRDLPSHYARFRWMPDGQAVAYAAKQSGIGNIWLQPLDGSGPKQLTHWRADPIFSFDWSRDGKWLAYASGTVTSDVVLISDAGP